MSSDETPAAFQPTRDPRGKLVIGYELHVGDSAPSLPAGYALCTGAPAGSGPPPMSTDLDVDVVEFLADSFRFRSGARATNALESTQKAIAAMLWPGTGTLAAEFCRQFPDDKPGGRLAFGPVWHVWANAVAVELGHAGLDNWIGTGTNFADLAWLAVHVHGVELAWHPLDYVYRVDSQRHWRASRVETLDIDRFNRAMWSAGTSLARTFGQLCPGATFDPTVVNPAQVIAGDGIEFGSPTGVTEFKTVDPDDERVVTITRRKTRAVNPRRARTDLATQNRPRDPKNEGKGTGSNKRRNDIQAPGRNTVFISTRVADMSYTRVILAVGQVPSTTNEGTFATEMIAEFADYLHGAVQHVAWDGAMLPLHRDSILNRSGALVGNRNRTDKLTDALSHASVAGGAVYGVTERRRKIIYSATNTHLTARTGKTKAPDLRKSTHATLGYVSHRAPGGGTCEHLLAGDDSRLVELTADALGTPHPWPETLDGPTMGTMHRWHGPGAAPHGALYLIRTRYQMRCDTTDQTLTLWLEHRPIDGPTPNKQTRIENVVRAVPESIDPAERNQFDVIHGIRQDPESGNSVTRSLSSSKTGRVALYGDGGAWWTAVGHFVYQNADIWIRRTRLFIR